MKKTKKKKGTKEDTEYVKSNLYSKAVEDKKKAVEKVNEKLQKELNDTIKENLGLKKTFKATKTSKEIQEQKEQKKSNSPVKFSFKPEINPKSRDLYSNYLVKLKDLNNNESGQVNDQGDEDEKLAYVNRLINKKKKNLTENEKKKVELMEKELEGCTFKPDLALSAKYNKNANKEQEKTSKEKRIDQLHNQGTQKLAKRQDQDFIDYDLKKYGQECTFTPSTNKEVPDLTGENDIHNNKSYMLLYDRLKRGRAERVLKESLNSREIIPKSILIELNKPKLDLSNMSSTFTTTMKQGKSKSPPKNVHGTSDNKNKKNDLSSKEELIDNEKIDINSNSVGNKSENSNDNMTGERSKFYLIIKKMKYLY